jgi:hypothetical protein
LRVVLPPRPLLWAPPPAKAKAELKTIKKTAQSALFMVFIDSSKKMLDTSSKSVFFDSL